MRNVDSATQHNTCVQPCTQDSTHASLLRGNCGDADYVSERKNLRQAALARRLALSEEECLRRSEMIRGNLQTRFARLAHMRVGFCWPFKNEPDLRPLLETWLRQNVSSFEALLPVVVDAESPLSFREWTPDVAMQTDRFGIPFPVAGQFAHPEALLIPLVAFDRAGYRLGYGGGFFDRTLSTLQPKPLSIGIGFELSCVDTIYPQPHDERLDAIVTESTIIEFS